ncbi:energy transducer TonB [Nitrospira sp. Nam80]
MAEESTSYMARGPDLQGQAWLASVALHAAAVTLVLVAPFHLAVDATAPFRWDVRLVEQDISAPQTIEAGEGDNGLPQPVETARPVQRRTQLRKIVTQEELPVQGVVTQSINRQVITPESSAVATESVHSEPVAKDAIQHTAVERSNERQQYEVKRSEIRDGRMTGQQPSLLGAGSVETTAVVTPGSVQRQAALIRPAAVQGASAETRPSPIAKPMGSQGGEATSLRKLEILEKPSAETAEMGGSGQASHATTSSEARTATVGPMASASVFGSGKGAGPDYGWLKRLLWERINRVKNYSDDAVEYEWEGRVVMVVTIRSDGRIDDVSVAESSGNGSLDREAAVLIKRASPLELDRALGATRVRFRVPISFGLE